MLLRDGFYTVAFKSLEVSGHRTFKIETQKPDARFAPGKTVISFLVGPLNTSDYKGLGFIVEGKLLLWKKYQGAKDVSTIVKCAELLISGSISDRAGKLYAMESGNCYVCNRLLTDPESIKNGIGPVCAGRKEVEL